MLAVLSGGRGPAGPRLLPVDAAGRLLTSTTPTFADLLTQTANPGDGVLHVADYSIYSVGMVLLFPQFGANIGGRLSDYVCRVAIIGKDFGLQSGTLAVNPFVPTTILAQQPFLVMPPPSSWVAPPPWQQPLSPPVTTAQVGLGNTVMVAGSAGQMVWCFSGMIEITLAVAGSFIQLTDTAGNVRLQVRGDVAGQVPFDLKGAPIGGVGAGAKIAVAGGAANGVINLTYSQG